MSIVPFLLLWAGAVTVLASRGLTLAWLGLLFAFPPACGLLFGLEPSFRGPDGAAYLRIGVIVAAAVWVLTALISTIAWWIGSRRG